MKICVACGSASPAPDWRCPACGHVPETSDGLPILAPGLESDTGYPADAFERLSALGTGSFWFRARNELITWALQSFEPRMQRYLEIGCGTGYVLSSVHCAFRGASLVGSEVASVGLRHAVARGVPAEFLQMDARHIPYRDEFDAIGAFDVLEQIDEDELVLRQMFQALRPGGSIVVTVPQHSWLWSAEDEYACHQRRYARGELRRKVGLTGFTLQFETSFVSLLLPAMLASRMGKRKSAASDLEELRLPRWMDQAFDRIMTVERRLIRAGARFPVGGSGLLVACRPS